VTFASGHAGIACGSGCIHFKRRLIASTAVLGGSVLGAWREFEELRALPWDEVSSFLVELAERSSLSLDFASLSLSSLDRDCRSLSLSSLERDCRSSSLELSFASRLPFLAWAGVMKRPFSLGTKFSPTCA